MSKTLYRTYRPKDFSDVLGQDVIIKTLQNTIAQNRIGHAYLFTGPRGTGKTTVARLFATAINTQKRKGFESVSKETAKRLQNGDCLDVIEIDAASNTGVDDIRTLKENINITPAEARYKIYIIDEVHMLSANAFNALLKTLEEPPEHVVFILATTEIHKVPTTILSRCQRFDFSRFSIDNIIKKLIIIADAEHIKITPEALELIAIAADGGMRDAESLLAQVFALEDKEITAKTISEALGTTTFTEVLDLLTAFTQKDIQKSLITINNVLHSGYNMESFIRTVIEKLRILLFLSLAKQQKDIRNIISIPKDEIELLQKLAELSTVENIVIMIDECVRALQKTKNTTIVQLPIEVASVNICGAKIKPTTQQSTQTTKSIQPAKENINTKENKSAQKISENARNNAKDVTSDNLIKWNKCIKKITKENTSIAKLLTQCELSQITQEEIILNTTFSFYKEKLTQSKNRTMIENVLQEEFDNNPKINITLTEKSSKPSSELLNYAKQLMNNKTVTD